jgi:hypothetical protein
VEWDPVVKAMCSASRLGSSKSNLTSPCGVARVASVGSVGELHKLPGTQASGRDLLLGQCCEGRDEQIACVLPNESLNIFMNITSPQALTGSCCSRIPGPSYRYCDCLLLLSSACLEDYVVVVLALGISLRVMTVLPLPLSMREVAVAAYFFFDCL